LERFIENTDTEDGIIAPAGNADWQHRVPAILGDEGIEGFQEKDFFPIDGLRNLRLQRKVAGKIELPWRRA